MNDAWIGGVGAAVGGVTGLVAAVIAPWQQARSERNRIERDRRRENLHDLQDAIDPVFRQLFLALQSRWPGTASVAVPSAELSAAFFRPNLLSVRVGDQPLANSLGAVLAKLREARNAGSEQAVFDAYNEALALLSPIHQRVGQLLHTDIENDPGTAREPQEPGRLQTPA